MSLIVNVEIFMDVDRYSVLSLDGCERKDGDIFSTLLRLEPSESERVGRGFLFSVRVETNAICRPLSSDADIDLNQPIIDEAEKQIAYNLDSPLLVTPRTAWL